MPSYLTAMNHDHVYQAGLLTFATSFGSDILGMQYVECYDTNGVVQWTFLLWNKAVIHNLIADENGNVYVSGVYVEDLFMTGDSMTNSDTSFMHTDMFLIAIDNASHLKWKKNLTTMYPSGMNQLAMNIDRNGDCWYSVNMFPVTKIFRMDNTGTEVQNYSLTNAIVLSSFSFDENNNMFLAGATQSGPFNVAGLQVNVNETYNMYVARIDAQGSCSWIRLAHDVTFQSPEIVATKNGGAFVAGSLMDSTTFGSIHFNGPRWVFDVFLTKVDSSGNFLWGVEPPYTTNVTGDFDRGKKGFIDVDSDGNVYMTGNVRGTIDWGNNVISNHAIMPVKNIDIISFDGNGLARWQYSGGTDATNVSFSVKVKSPDVCYFTAAVTDSALFDNITVPVLNDYTAILGKIGGQVTTSVNIISGSDVMTVFPNPSKGIIHLRCSQKWNTLEVYNSLEECVYFCKMISDYFDLDVSKFQRGVYFILVHCADDLIITKKIVVE